MMGAVDAIVLEKIAQRRNTGDLDRDDVLGIFLRTTDDDGALMERWSNPVMPCGRCYLAATNHRF